MCYVLCVPCYVKIDNYLEKLRTKPERVRRRIAVAATGAAFAVILVIWFFSFSELSTDAGKESETDSLPNQLEEAKNGISPDGQSIEDMMEGFSEEDLGVGEEIPNEAPDAQSEEASGSEAQDADNSSAEPQDNQPEIPPLP